VQEKLKRQMALSSALDCLSKAIITQEMSNDQMYQMVLESARELTESQHGFVSSVESQTGAHISNTLTKMRADGCTIPADFITLPEGSQKQDHGLWGHSLNIYNENSKILVLSRKCPESDNIIKKSK
jgi:hypothetical protein